MEALHVLAVVVGALLALVTTVHIVRTLVVPRASRTLMSHIVDTGVDAIFLMIVRPMRSYARKDKVLAAQGAAVILAQLASWLICYEVAYALLLWPSVGGFPSAFRQAGSSMFTLGFASTSSAAPTVIDVLAAATGVLVVALQVGYLPTLYSAFNRRETEVTLLLARAGSPPWGRSFSCVPATGSRYAAMTYLRSIAGGSVGRPTSRRATPIIPCLCASAPPTSFLPGS